MALPPPNSPSDPFCMYTMASTDEETWPFLANENAPDKKTSKDRQRPLKPRFQKTHIIFYVFQTIFLTLNISLFVINLTSASRYAKHDFDSDSPGKTFSPAQSAIQYTVEELGYEQTPFTGEPRPEVDQAWSQLLRSTMVRISEDEMKRMNKTSITLRDGTGYVGYLEVHHMLHCVKRLYQTQHPDYYAKLKADGGLSIHHLYHCLEVLRQGIMCNADVTVNTFFWETPHKMKGDRSGPRKCTDWSRLQAWADDRTLWSTGKDEFLLTLVPSNEAVSIGPI